MPSELFACWICKPSKLEAMRNRLPGYEGGKRKGLPVVLKVKENKEDEHIFRWYVHVKDLTVQPDLLLRGERLAYIRLSWYV